MKSGEYIGINDLIREIKRDLLSNVEDSPNLFSIDEVSLEISFTVSGDIQSGLNFGVVTLGSKISEDRVHKICVKLTPLFSKHQLMKKKNQPTDIQTNALIRGEEENEVK